MVKLDSILESRAISLPTKVHIVKAMVFPVVRYGCEKWTIKKAECRPERTSEEILRLLGWLSRLLSVRGILSAACSRRRKGTPPPKKRASRPAAAGQKRTDCTVFTGWSHSAPLPSRPWCRRNSGRSPGEGSGSAGDSTAEELGRCFVGKKECCPHCSPVAP